MSSFPGLSDYKILTELGSGISATVYEAQNRKNGKNYAIKRFHSCNASLTGSYEGQNEIHIMKTLNHPNIIKLYEIRKVQQQIYLIMELVQNGDLFQAVLENGCAFDDRRARHIFQQLIDVLDYLHKKRTVHRDLKPENILLGENDTVKLADFGISKTSSDQSSSLYRTISQLQTKCGTESYMAPEISKNGTYDGKKADIYGAGLVLYVMVHFRTPAADQPISISPFLDPDLVDLLTAMTALDPNHRPTIEQIRQNPWFSVDYHPIQGYPDDYTEDSAPPPYTQQYELTAFDLISKLVQVNASTLIDSEIKLSKVFSFTTKSTIDEITQAFTAATSGNNKDRIDSVTAESFRVIKHFDNDKCVFTVDISPLDSITTLVTCKGLQKFDEKAEDLCSQVHKSLSECK